MSDLNIQNLNKTIKQLKFDKGAIASQFKHVERDSAQFHALKKDMQLISDAIKRAESELKVARKASSEGEAEKNTDKPLPPPAQFILTTAIFNEDIQIRAITENNIPAQWWSLLEQQNASAYHDKDFSQLLSSSLGLEPLLIAAYSPSDELLGGLPIFITDSRIFGRFATSIPHVNYGGPISPYINVREAIMEALPRFCGQFSLSNIQVRSTEKFSDWPCSIKKVSMLRELPETARALDQSVGAKVRAQAKKANQHSPEIKFGQRELLEDFYHVFSINMRDLGTPVYAKQWFDDYLQQLPTSAELCIGYVNGKPISCGFLMYSNEMVEIPWASTLRRANQYDINMWMYNQILLHCIEKGYRWFDFGRSTKDAGTYRFKKQWGAKPLKHYWYSVQSDGFVVNEGLTPDNPKFKLAIAIWQRLPVFITRLIGPIIAKDLV